MTKDSKDELLRKDWASEWGSLPEAPELVPRRKTAQITLRLPAGLLARVKRAAAAQSLPYHALARSWLSEGLREPGPPAAPSIEDPNTEQLNIKLSQHALDELKARARELRRPYHRLAREWLAVAVSREEKRLGLELAGAEHPQTPVGDEGDRLDTAPFADASYHSPSRRDEIYELDDLSQRDFDAVVAQLLEVQGYSHIRAHSESFGAAITANKADETYAIHSKQSLNRLGAVEVRQALGGMAYHAANRAMLITNSFLTDSARRLADEAHLELVDRAELRRWISDAGALAVPRTVTPRPHQRETLNNLRRLRGHQQQRALVVMASGLGKTYVAALDAQQYEEEAGRPMRILYLSHQAVILQQARDSFERVFGPRRTYGHFDADRRELDTDLVFASFQSLYRSLDRVSPGHFDYVVVDEAHHTAAPTRDAVVRHLTPRFLLGLTATPFRGDGKDISAYYGDVLASSIPLERAVADGLLAPIDYRVVSDDVDPGALAAALQMRNGATNGHVFSPLPDEAIVNTVWREAAVVDGKRKVLVFCASLAQMDHFAKVFPSSRTISGRDARAQQIAAVEDLRSGLVEVLLSRDVLNEGIDIPHAATLVFLRNTESPTIFFQQLGRGLRRTEGKDRVDVFDFVNTLTRVEFVYSFFSRLESEQATRRSLRGDAAAGEFSSLALDNTARDVVTGLIRKKQRSGRIADLDSLSGALDYNVSAATLRRIVTSGRLVPDFVMPSRGPHPAMYFESGTLVRFMRQVGSPHYTEGLLAAPEFARRLGKPVSWVRSAQRRGTLAASWIHRRPNGTLEPYFEPDDVMSVTVAED